MVPLSSVQIPIGSSAWLDPMSSDMDWLVHFDGSVGSVVFRYGLASLLDGQLDSFVFRLW